MRSLADRIRRFARADANVLIAGETGAGKNAAHLPDEIFATDE
jgi:DNA-binding NtrC family response regulator